MADQCHHHLNPETIMAEASEALARKGEQWTPLRQVVFQSLAGFNQPASAYDIAEKVSTSEGRRIAANTVYRILDLFVQANVAKRIESRNAFLACIHPEHAHDCIFLVCDHCGATTHIDDDGVTAQLRTIAKDKGFSPELPIIEVKGRCAQCAATL